ncbi:MAG TPA: DUF6549 family protein [Cyclobacteriaceae bacterium]|jgi:hypothetical protein|nr:DUF6549 family protein [Cyclobacteriaceae bacterium]
MNKYVIIITIIAILIIAFLLHRVNVLQDDKQSLSSVVAEKNDSIHYHKTKNGQLVAEKFAAEMKAKDLEKNYPVLARQIEQMGIELKSVKAVMQAGFTAHGSGNSYITHNHYTDSTGRSMDSTHLNVSDGYLAFRATIYDSLHAPYKYTYSDVITMTMSTKKKWLFGKERLYGSGMLGNPNAKITNSTSVLMKDYKDKRFSIGPYVGYDPIQNRPSVGIGMQWALIKF